MPFLAALLFKFPFLIKVKDFLKSGKFLTLLIILIVSLFLVVQVASFVTGYVDNQVKQQTEIVNKNLQIDQLKSQVKVMEQNQKIVDRVVGETRVIQIEQKQKTERIEERINEQVKNGEDGYTGPVLSSVIDSL